MNNGHFCLIDNGSKQGIVKRFCRKIGYGFIDSDGKLYFFHRDEILNSKGDVFKGESVIFEHSEENGRLIALAVRHRAGNRVLSKDMKNFIPPAMPSDGLFFPAPRRIILTVSNGKLFFTSDGSKTKNKKSHEQDNKNENKKRIVETKN